MASGAAPLAIGLFAPIVRYLHDVTSTSLFNFGVAAIDVEAHPSDRQAVLSPSSQLPRCAGIHSRMGSSLGYLVALTVGRRPRSRVPANDDVLLICRMRRIRGCSKAYNYDRLYLQTVELTHNH